MIRYQAADALGIDLAQIDVWDVPHSELVGLKSPQGPAVRINRPGWSPAKRVLRPNSGLERFLLGANFATQEPSSILKSP